MSSDVTYEVYSRPPARKGRRQPIELYAVFPESKWQFALKVQAMLVRKGHTDVVVREVLVTHELRARGSR